jgi:hypothetical protein
MNKQQLLEELSEAYHDGEISREEILTSLDAPYSQPADPAHRKLSLSSVLYYIGAGIVFFGLVIFVYQNWNYLNSIARILVSLGSAIAAYMMGAMLFRHEDQKELSLSFFLISGLLLPVGLGVAFYESGLDTASAQVQSLISGIAFAVSVFTFMFFRSSLFIIFQVLFATWSYFALTSYIFMSLGGLADGNWFAYRTLVLGLSYLFLAFHLSHGSRKSLVNWLNVAGLAAFLGSVLVLGGYSPSQNAFWEIIFPGLVFAVILLSVYLKNNVYLIMGAVFLMIYILKITGEYFSQGLGWPVSLIVAGLLLIGVGFLTVRLKKKYLV